MNTFIIEFVINICELKINIYEKFSTKCFLNFFVNTAFTNFLRFEFIKIINWFNCEIFLFFVFSKHFETHCQLCVSISWKWIFIFLFQTHNSFLNCVCLWKWKTISSFLSFLFWFFFVFFFDCANVKSHCVFFSTHDTFYVKIIYFCFAHFCVVFFHVLFTNNFVFICFQFVIIMMTIVTLFY